jgi:hypothetical protein
MNPFPSTPDEFYRLRDDRSNECVPNLAYQNVRCTVRVSHELIHTYAGQAMVIVVCNLLSRWCRRVDAELPRVQKHARIGLPGTELSQMTLLQMRDADPFGEFRFASKIQDTGDIEIHVGSGVRRHNRTVTIDAGGWIAFVDHLTTAATGAAREQANPIGPAAAACLGVAEAFKHAVGLRDETPRSIIFDAYHLVSDQKTPGVASFPNDVDLGKLLIVGGGSVGSATAYFLRVLHLTGELKTVDHDIVKVENFNRSPIFGKSTYGLGKAPAIVTFLDGSRMRATSFEGDWDRFTAEHRRSAYDFDIWLPLANERNVRWSMQNAIPPLMIHASTSRNWAVNFGHHIANRDDCIVDRFPEATTPLKCAEGKVPAQKGGTDAALPFLSFLAGLLIVADLVRLKMPGYPQVSNHALFWLGDGLNIQSWDREPRPTCVCQQQPKNIWDKYNATTRYAYLSLAS